MNSAPGDPPFSLLLSTGGVLRWHEYGDHSGQPLLFFHGWPSCGGQGVFLDALGKERGIRIISPNRPGLGGSTRQSGRSLLDWPPVIAELAESLDLGPLRMMGVSGGGPYALACAWALGSRIARTSIVCGAPPLDGPEARRQFSPVYRAMLAVHDRSPSSLSAFLSLATRLARVPVPFAAFRAVTGMLGPRDRMALRDKDRFNLYYPSFMAAMRSGGRALYEDGQVYPRPWGFDPDSIFTPVQFWHGSEDSNFHWSLAEKLAGRIRHSSFNLVEEGHYSLPVFQAVPILDALMS